MNTALSEFSDVMNLVVGSDGKTINENHRQRLSAKAEDEILTINAGMKSLGGMMAAAALNEDWGGINNQEIADIGFLIQWLGKMQLSLSNLGGELDVMAGKGGRGSPDGPE